MEPSIIFYWAKNQWKLSPKTFYTQEEVNHWYKMNRHRIDGLSVVKKLSEKEETLKRLTEA